MFRISLIGFLLIFAHALLAQEESPEKKPFPRKWMGRYPVLNMDMRGSLLQTNSDFEGDPFDTDGDGLGTFGQAINLRLNFRWNELPNTYWFVGFGTRNYQIHLKKALMEKPNGNYVFAPEANAPQKDYQLKAEYLNLTLGTRYQWYWEDPWLIGNVIKQKNGPYAEIFYSLDVGNPDPVWANTLTAQSRNSDTRSSNQMQHLNPFLHHGGFYVGYLYTFLSEVVYFEMKVGSEISQSSLIESGKGPSMKIHQSLSAGFSMGMAFK